MPNYRVVGFVDDDKRLYVWKGHATHERQAKAILGSILNKHYNRRIFVAYQSVTVVNSTDIEVKGAAFDVRRLNKVDEKQLTFNF
jgi:hypothetical protein